VPQYEEAPRCEGGVSKISRAGSDHDTAGYLLAEAAVVGAAILSTDARAGILDALDPDDFESEAHRTWFEALRAMHDDELHVDVVTSTLWVCDRDLIDQAGGYAAACDLVHPLACPHPSAWEHYARAVRAAGDRRRAVAHHLSALQELGVVA
jgi:replicative DNA helicase